jgi:hypothetical protein
MQPFLLSLERAERIIPLTLGRSGYQIHLSITTTRTSLGADARYDDFEYTSSANCGGKRTVHPAVLLASIRSDSASAIWCIGRAPAFNVTHRFFNTWIGPTRPFCHDP